MSTRNELMISELLRPPDNPFDGSNPIEFERWLFKLERKFQRCKADPEDQIEVFETHTGGEAKTLVRLLSSNFKMNANYVVMNIKNELRRRFGSELAVAKALLQKIVNFPKMFDNEAPDELSQKMRDFSDLCLQTSFRVKADGELSLLNTPIGLQFVREKLPGYLNKDWSRYRYAYFLENPEMSHPRFDIFANFVKNEADSMIIDQGSIHNQSGITCIFENDQSIRSPCDYHGPKAKHLTVKCRILRKLNRLGSKYKQTT